MTKEPISNKEGKEKLEFCCEKCSGRVEDENGFAHHYGCQRDNCDCHSAPESRGDWEERFREKFVRTSYPFLGGQHDNFKEIDVPTEIFEMELIERIEDFIQSELTLAHTEGIEEGRNLMDNICTVGGNFPARCYECGEKHSSGISWEEAYKINALFAKCPSCVGKEVNISSLQPKDK